MKKGVFIVLSTIFSLFGMIAFYATPTLAACNATFSSGSHDPKFGGASDNTVGWTGGSTTRAIRADLWNYVPSSSNLFESSSFWAMILNCVSDCTNTAQYAQTGYMAWPGHVNDYIFSEWNDNGSFSRQFYNTSTNLWYDTAQSVVTTVETYLATWVYNNPTDHQVQMSFDGRTIRTATVSWTPQTWTVSSEQHDFGTNSPTNYGDQVVGDYNNHIHADSIQFYDNNGSGWTNPGTPLSWVGNVGNASTDTNSVTGIGFRVWDNRCQP